MQQLTPQDVLKLKQNDIFSKNPTFQEESDCGRIREMIESILTKDQLYPYESLTKAAITNDVDLATDAIKKCNDKEIDKHVKSLDNCLLVSVLYNSANVASFLLQNGANVHCRLVSDNQFGRTNDTPVFLAARFGHAEVMAVLLDNDANVDIDHILTGHCNIVTLLMDRGYDITKTDTHWKNTLMWAAQRENYDMVLFLLNTKKFNVNLRDTRGKTALISAAEFNKSTKVVELLISHGAHPGIKDSKGRTAYVIAAEYNRNLVGFFSEVDSIRCDICGTAKGRGNCPIGHESGYPNSR